MSEETLKACPLCGAAARPGKLRDTHIYYVWCSSSRCRLNGPERKTPILAAIAWNKRAGDREPAMTQTPAISTLASSNGSAAFGIIDPEYARIYTVIRLLAWQEGYAAMMHGSFTRDLDIVAVPWTDKACEPEHLVRRVLASNLNLSEADPGKPGSKPHGRLVWTLMLPEFGDPRFVDFSIMPPNVRS